MVNQLKGGEQMFKNSKLYLMIGTPYYANAFKKIKKCIESCESHLHLQSCSRMIRNFGFKEEDFKKLEALFYSKSFEICEKGYNSK